MNVFFLGVLIFLVTFYIRVRPRISQRDFGIDSWYFLLYADELRKQKRIPVKLPFFLMESTEDQYYPPALPVLLSFFSKGFLEKYHWAISACIDAGQAVFLYGISYVLTRGLGLSVLASMVYAVSPILVTQNSNLNSRSLGSFVMTLTVLGTYGYYSTSKPCFLILAILAGAMLLHTHKLASQQLLFLMMGLSVCYFNSIFAIIFICIFLAAVILSKGYYLKIIKGQIGVLKFWKKNLPFLGVHQVYCSPHYEDINKARSNSGCGGMAASKIWFNLTKFQFIFLVALVFLYAFKDRAVLKDSDIFFLSWFLIVFLTVTAITYLPSLRFIGEGYRYFTYGVFPAAFLLPRLIFGYGSSQSAGGICLVVFLVISLLLVNKIHYEQKSNILAFVGDDLRAIMEYIRCLPRDNIMSFPISHCEHIAYFCRKRVLWGGHGSGFDTLLQPFFPVLREPVEYFIDRYNISYCLLNQDYVSIEDLRLPSGKYTILLEKGRYILLEFVN